MEEFKQVFKMKIESVQKEKKSPQDNIRKLNSRFSLFAKQVNN